MSEKIEPTSDDPKAPFGFDENDQPIAPYGFKVNGLPRISNRGAKPGQRGNSNSSKPATKSSATVSKTDVKRKEMLVSLTDMFVSTPLAGLSTSPILKKKVGEKQADALAGDAVIISHFSPHIADSLIVLSQTKPGALAWLDTVEEKAPYLMLAQVGMQMVKAFVGNHINPDPRLASAGRLAATMRVTRMAQEIEEEARAMGISSEQMAEAA